MKPRVSKQQYRSELGIISAILHVTMDCGRRGAIVSWIARRANLSHYAVIEKCEKLINAGLVESTSNHRNHTFVITEKGIRFSQQMQEFAEMAQAIKIRY